MDRIIVCMKQVPSTTTAGFDPETNNLDRSGIPATINPADLCALEAALSLRDATGCSVSALTMGAGSAAALLREVAERGVTDLFLVSDPAFAGSDSFATATILSRALRHIGGADLVLCGRRAIDGETGQTGPEIAELLAIPCVTNVLSLELAGDGKLVCERLTDHRRERVEMILPGLATLCEGMSRLRPPSIAGLRKARSAAIVVIDRGMLGIDPLSVGTGGSFTRVRRLFEPPDDRRPCLIEEDPAAGARTACEMIVDLLKASPLETTS